MIERKYIIGVLSAAGYEGRRQACRETWLFDLPLVIEAVFVVGSEAVQVPTRDKDVLLIPSPDHYSLLPLKTRWFCRWALHYYRFDYLLKCDDDTYVHIDRLLQQEFTNPYIGYDMNPSQRLGLPYASGGAGYLLNRQAAQGVVDRMLPCEGAEDILVAQALMEAKIELTVSDKFQPYSCLTPTRHNDIITSHYINPELMRTLSRSLSD